MIFSSDHDSWEPVENLPKGKIAAFNKKQEQDESSDEEEKSDDEDREYTVEVLYFKTDFVVKNDLENFNAKRSRKTATLPHPLGRLL